MDTFFTLFPTPEFHLTLLALVGLVAAEGMVALWAATSRWHWFWRALAVWASILILIPIRAYQAALIFAISSPLLIAVVALSRWLLRRLDPQEPTAHLQLPRFTIRDVFLFILLIGLSLPGLVTVYRNLQAVPVLRLMKVAIAIAVPLVLTYLVVTQRRRWLTSTLLVASLPVAAGLLDSASGVFLGTTGYGFFLSQNILPCTALFVAELTLVALALTMLAQYFASAGARTRLSRSLAAAALLLFALPLVLLYWRMLDLAPFPSKLESASNHFERIDQIASRYVNQQISFAEREKLRHELISLLHASNSVPFDPLADSTVVYYVESLPKMEWRQLARALQAEGQAAAASGNYDEAADLAMANVRLGATLQRGGLVLDYFLGVAIEATGVSDLVVLGGNLSPQKIQAIIGLLEATARQREPIHAINARDYAFEERAFGCETRLYHIVQEFTRGGPNWTLGEEIRMRTEVYNALLRTDLAARLFHHQHGRWPESLEELVPAYLPEIPIDSFAHQPLRYRSTGESFALYSVGKDGKDDRGVFGNWKNYWQNTGYDLDLETLTRP